MRRDVVHFFRADVKSVYQAYLAAAQNRPFERSCTQNPYYCFQFGLNFSMKYNMNGGSCTLRFIPYQDGTAVNVRFTLAQGVGARYEAYDRALTEKAVELLRIPAQPLRLNVEAFLEERNWVTPDRVPLSPEAGNMPPQMPVPPPPPPMPVQPPQQVVAAAPGYAPPPPKAPGEKCCQGCGTILLPDAKFCFHCGAPAAQPKCRNCGSPLPPDAFFCHYCGQKQ